MLTYQYTAISRNGEKVTGVIEAYNELDAVDRIKQTCDVVLKMKEVKEGQEGGLLTREIGGEKLDAKAFTVMCSQFAIIIRSGIPIARAVRLIADKTTDKPLRRILKKVASDVEAGRSVAASFAAALAFDLIPALAKISAGTRTIILTVVIAAAAAALFPVKEAEEEGGHDQ